MTDAEIKKRLKEIDPSLLDGPEERGWWRAAIREARVALAERTFNKAVEVLTKYGWGDPADCAKVLRR